MAPFHSIFEIPGCYVGAASEIMKVAFPNATLMVPFAGRHGASGCSVWSVMTFKVVVFMMPVQISKLHVPMQLWRCPLGRLDASR